LGRCGWWWGWRQVWRRHGRGLHVGPTQKSGITQFILTGNNQVNYSCRLAQNLVKQKPLASRGFSVPCVEGDRDRAMLQPPAGCRRCCLRASRCDPFMLLTVPPSIPPDVRSIDPLFGENDPWFLARSWLRPPWSRRSTTREQDQQLRGAPVSTPKKNGLNKKTVRFFLQSRASAVSRGAPFFPRHLPIQHCIFSFDGNRPNRPQPCSAWDAVSSTVFFDF
jgi:hypothetical protein